MQKIGSSTPTADKNGEFTDGDPQREISCTWVMAAWLNTLQRELVHLCEEAGITLNPKDDTQVYKAISALLNHGVEGMVKSINTTHKPDAAGNVTLTADDVSAFAIRKNLTAADSPNALHGTAMFGHYGVPGAAGATVVKGYPIDGFIGAIFVMWGPNATQQVAFNNDGRQFTRAATGAWNGIDGPWSAWHEAAMSSLMLPNDASVTRLDDPAIINVTRPITLAGKFEDHPLGPAFVTTSQLQTFHRYFNAGAVGYQQLTEGNGQIFIRVGSYSAASGWAWKLAGTSGYPFGWRRVFDSGNPPTPAETGAFPLPNGSLSVDLNTLGGYGAAGVYYQAANAGATAANHYPMSEAGTLLVTPSAYGCQHEYTTFSSRRKFVRGLADPWNGTNGPWEEWIEFFSPNHKPTKADVDLGNVGNFAAVQQGGGAGMGTNKVYIGWTGAKVKIQVDASDMGEVYTTNFPPPAPNLSGYATTAWVTQSFSTAIRLGAQYTHASTNDSHGTVQLVNGEVFCGAAGVGGSDFNKAVWYVRPIQYWLNGQWVQAGSV